MFDFKHLYIYSYLLTVVGIAEINKTAELLN